MPKHCSFVALNQIASHPPWASLFSQRHSAFKQIPKTARHSPRSHQKGKSSRSISFNRLPQAFKANTLSHASFGFCIFRRRQTEHSVTFSLAQWYFTFSCSTSWDRFSSAVQFHPSVSFPVGLLRSSTAGTVAIVRFALREVRRTDGRFRT